MTDSYECMNCGVLVTGDQANWDLCHDELGARCRRTRQPSCYLEVNAGSDVNGNPRRAAVIYGISEHDDFQVASVLDVIDEGYEGYPEWVKKLGYLGQFPVPVRMYRAYLKRAAA